MSTHTIRRVYDDPAIPPVRRRELWAWAGYDFSNSSYTTVVITAVFNAYFVGTVAANASWATLAWTAALSVSYVIIMLSAPLLGVYADARAAKKPLLLACTVLCVLGTAGLALVGPGDVALALALLVISNVAFGSGENLIAAFLPELAHERGMGRLSGYGWALGYVGAVGLLGICLWWILGAEARGDGTADAVREAMLITASCMAMAALPTFLLLRERARPQPWPLTNWHDAFGQLRDGWIATRRLQDLRRFLFCLVAYQAGVGTVITVAAIYTAEALGFSTTESIQLILLVNITAAIGAAAFGHLQDRIGHRPTLAISLVGWLIAVALLAVSEARPVVWIAANIAGLCMGASQSAGRALVGWFCPLDREAEIFSLWGFATKAAMILGPLAYGAISWLSGGDHRRAILATAVFFVVGLVLLQRVDVARGRVAALS